jgi:hypothetical protein
VSWKRVHLGTAPGTGKAASSACMAFKRAVKGGFKLPDGVSLVTVHDEQKSWVEAICDNPEAEAWAHAVKAYSPELWQKTSERRTGKARG